MKLASAQPLFQGRLEWQWRDRGSTLAPLLALLSTTTSLVSRTLATSSMLVM